MLSTLPGEGVPAPPMPWSAEKIFSLAAEDHVNDRKPHQGVTGQNPGLHRGLTACNSTTALGVNSSQSSGTAPGATVTYDYDAFGNKINSTGTTPNNFLYRGEQFDPDLALYYLRARYYNPLSGRFMSRDPNKGNLFDPRSLRKYLYAGGDPVNLLDPTGRDDEEEESFLTSFSQRASRALGALTEGATQAAAVVQRVAGLAYIRLSDYLSALAASEYTGAVVKTFFCISLGEMLVRMLNEVDLSEDEKEAALIDYKLVCSLAIIAPWDLGNSGFGGGDDDF